MSKPEGSFKWSHHCRSGMAWLGQGVLYALFALGIGVFSSWPPYRTLAPDQALIKLSIVHTSQRMQACRERSAEELAKLPPNMRAPMQCARERAPVTVEVDVDGQLAYRHVAQPSGLSSDGPASLYHRMPVAAGTHNIAVRLQDSVGATGFDATRVATVALKPAQVLVIDFNPERGGITLQ